MNKIVILSVLTILLLGCSENIYIQQLNDLPECADKLNQPYCIQNGETYLSYNYTYVRIAEDKYIVINQDYTD